MKPSSAKVEDQFKYVKASFGITPHTFLSQIATGIQGRISAEVPNISTRLTGKAVAGSNIQLMITGITITASAEEHDATAQKIRVVMDELKNVNTLLGMLD